MEIDVRKESGGKPDVIRFGNDPSDVVCYDPSWAVIGLDKETHNHYYVMVKDIPNLIKALKKYQELYGND